MTAISPFRPAASVGPDAAALSRRVGRGLAFPLAQGVTLRVALDTGTTDPAADPVVLDGPHGALHLADGRAFLRALTGIEPAFGTGDSAAWLQAGLLGRLRGGPLGGFQRIAPAAAPPDDGVALRLTLSDADHTFGTAAVAAAATWRALLGAPVWQPVRAPAAPFLALVARLPVPLASHRLPMGILGALTAGDVVLPDTPRVAVDGTGWLRWPGRRAQVRHHGTGAIELLTLEAAMEEQDDVQVAEPARQPDDGDALAQGGAPLRIDFRLGTLALTLGELRTLAPGTVLELEEGGAGAIAIACGGRVLGQGEAVDVAGRLGIRITRWDAPC